MVCLETVAKAAPCNGKRGEFYWEWGVKWARQGTRRVGPNLKVAV